MTASIPLRIYIVMVIFGFVAFGIGAPRYVRFAVPEKSLASVGCSLSFDRGTNSSSLFPSPTALGLVPASIPLHV